jgi:hypothetical protein
MLLSHVKAKSNELLRQKITIRVPRLNQLWNKVRSNYVELSVTHSKLNLPTKVCLVCGLEFSYRKKWRNSWESVIYCSERCRRGKEAAKNIVSGGAK